jgi:opacity protein-like surface antigen
MGNESMKAIAAALAGIAMASTPSLAADLFGTAAPLYSAPAENGAMTEVGSNWYLRGDIGYGSEDQPTVVPAAGLIPQVRYDIGGTGAAFVNAPIGDASHNIAVTRGNNQTSDGATFDIAVGYRVNNYLRLEAMYNFSRGPGLGYSQKTLCPDTTAAVSNTVIVAGSPVQQPVGYLWEPVPCTGYLNATQYNNLGLASAYVDLGTFWGVTPYIGAGAGVNVNTISGSTKFNLSNDGSHFVGDTTASGGAPLQWVVLNGTGPNNSPNYTPLSTQPNVVFGQQNWDRSFRSTKYTLAAALMAGVGIQMSPSATLDIGYRYLSQDLFGSGRNAAQQVQVGVRYMAN